jgi:putative transposase
MFRTCYAAVMPRSGRIVYPEVPHHVTQRGNRRGPIFFEPADQHVYLRILAEQVRRYEVEVWSYCLMPNHVHLILTPTDEIGLGRAIGETHRRYVAFVNGRSGWTGDLFQNRFSSVAMDEEHFISAARYVAMNPVRARLVTRAEDWPWSSARAHLAGKDDGVVRVRPLLERIGSFKELIADTEAADHAHAAAFHALRRAEYTSFGLVRGMLRKQGTAYAVPLVTEPS